MIKSNAAPKPDLDDFYGDPLEYLYFRANFKEVVESAIPDERGRLTRLIKYTQGDAKELIKHLVHADPAKCYTKALSLLDKEYGNPHLISCSYLKQLRQWKAIKEDDAPSFKKLYRFLLKCQTYKDTGQLKELDSTDMIKLIVSKLHTSYQRRWTRKAVEARRNHGHEADFSDLVKFMEGEAEILSDPAYSCEALADTGNLKVNVTQLSNPKSLSFFECPLCKKEHDAKHSLRWISMNVIKLSSVLDCASAACVQQQTVTMERTALVRGSVVHVMRVILQLCMEAKVRKLITLQWTRTLSVNAWSR